MRFLTDTILVPALILYAVVSMGYIYISFIKEQINKK